MLNMFENPKDVRGSIHHHVNSSCHARVHIKDENLIREYSEDDMVSIYLFQASFQHLVTRTSPHVRKP